MLLLSLFRPKFEFSTDLTQLEGLKFGRMSFKGCNPEVEVSESPWFSITIHILFIFEEIDGVLWTQNERRRIWLGLGWRCRHWRSGDDGNVSWGIIRHCITWPAVLLKVARQSFNKPPSRQGSKGIYFLLFYLLFSSQIFLHAQQFLEIGEALCGVLCSHFVLAGSSLMGCTITISYVAVVKRCRFFLLTMSFSFMLGGGVTYSNVLLTNSDTQNLLFALRESFRDFHFADNHLFVEGKR